MATIAIITLGEHSDLKIGKNDFIDLGANPHATIRDPVIEELNSLAPIPNILANSHFPHVVSLTSPRPESADNGSSILSTIGLRAAPGESAPNFAAGFLVANWAFAYCLMSPRVSKMRLGLDHNVSPREDLSKYGEAAVKEGKISQKTLNKLKRQEAAHANAVEGYPLFVAASEFLSSIDTVAC